MKSTWTQEEDNKLLELVKREGKKWGKISKEFNSRTQQACRARHPLLLERLERQNELISLYHTLFGKFKKYCGDKESEDEPKELGLMDIDTLDGHIRNLEHHLCKSFCAILGDEYDEDASPSIFLLEEKVQQRIAQS